MHISKYRSNVWTVDGTIVDPGEVNYDRCESANSHEMSTMLPGGKSKGDSSTNCCLFAKYMGTWMDGRT